MVKRKESKSANPEEWPVLEKHELPIPGGGYRLDPFRYGKDVLRIVGTEVVSEEGFGNKKTVETKHCLKNLTTGEYKWKGANWMKQAIGVL